MLFAKKLVIFGERAKEISKRRFVYLQGMISRLNGDYGVDMEATQSF